MSLLTAIADKARTSRRHIVLPEGDDVRMMQAAAALRADGIADISLVGARDSLEALAASHGKTAGNVVRRSSTKRAGTGTSLWRMPGEWPWTA